MAKKKTDTEPPENAAVEEGKAKRVTIDISQEVKDRVVGMAKMLGLNVAEYVSSRLSAVVDDEITRMAENLGLDCTQPKEGTGQ